MLLDKQLIERKAPTQFIQSVAFILVVVSTLSHGVDLGDDFAHKKVGKYLQYSTSKYLSIENYLDAINAVIVVNLNGFNPPVMPQALASMRLLIGFDFRSIINPTLERWRY